MSKVSFTKSQQDAISVESSNVLVSAAAGSGKTAVLTERVVRLLTKSDPVDANRLIIVTFTVLAAGEMRERIAAKLSDLIEQDPTNPLLLSQQQLLPTAKICTIHSLCSGLIRDNFQKLSIAPDFRIADETELGIIKNNAVELVFSKLYQEGNKAFLTLVAELDTKGDKKVSELVLTIYDFIRSLPFPKQFLDDCLDAYKTANDVRNTVWYPELKEQSLDAIEYATVLIQNGVDLMRECEPVLTAYGPSFNYDLLQLENIRNALLNDYWDEAVKLSQNYQKLTLRPVRNFEDKEFLELVKLLRKQGQDIISTVSERYLITDSDRFSEDIKKLVPSLEILFDTVKQIYDGIELAKQNAGVIDFADLEHLALKLLLKEGTTDEQSDLAKELCKGYDELLIDECQDINEVQNLIFRLLSDNEHNIFMVGDVKQSIYRFRKAVPTLFIEKKQAFPPYDFASHTKESCATITLDNNFRSRPQVCDFVNFVFEQIMTTKVGEIDYKNGEQLIASGSFSESDTMESEIHLVDCEGEDLKTEVEASYIANLIKRRVSEGMLVDDKGTTRPCRYGDFAILLRAKSKKSEIYQTALKNIGISAFSDATEGYFSEYEIAVTINLLRVIDNPLQDICLASVLMSPMFNIDADAITKIRLINRKAPLYIALLESAQQGDPNAIEFIEVISELRTKSKLCTSAELIQEIYDQTDFISLVYALDNGTQRDANLRLLLSYAERYEQIGSCGLSGFLRYIDRVIKNKQDFSSANISTRTTDTVKIMSIHASKGLEFPVCILADCAKGFNLKDTIQNHQLNSKLKFGMKITDRPRLRRYTNIPYEAIKLKSFKETISEEMRILYVAMTRAREKLIMVMTMADPVKKLNSLATTMGHTGEPSPYQVLTAKSYAEWILMSTIRHSELAHLVDIQLAPLANQPSMRVFLANSEEEQADVPEGTLSISEVDTELKSKIMSAINFSYPHSDLTRITAKVTATKLAKQEMNATISLKVNPLFLQEQGLTPSQKGTILHSFMQYADIEKASINLTKELQRLVDDEYMTEAQIEALDKGAIDMFLKSPLFSEMQSADRLLREYKFLHIIKASEVYDDLDPQYGDEEILLQGIADCVIIKDNKITIVDYKTDVVSNADILVERYRNQLYIYRDALGNALSLPVACMKLYSLYLGKEIEIK